MVCPKVTRSHLRTREATPGICPREWKTGPQADPGTRMPTAALVASAGGASPANGRTDGWMGQDAVVCARRGLVLSPEKTKGPTPARPWVKLRNTVPRGSPQTRKSRPQLRLDEVPRAGRLHAEREAGVCRGRGAAAGGHGVSSRLKEVPGSRSMWCLHSLAHALNATKWFPFKDLMRLLGTLSSGERKETRRRPPPTPRSPLLSGGEYPAPPPLRGSGGRGAPPTCSRGLGCWQSSPGVWLCRAGPPIPGKFASL